MQVFLGPLPQGFLRLEERNAQQQQEAADQQAALALHQLQMQNMPAMHEPHVGRLSITIVQVTLRSPRAYLCFGYQRFTRKDTFRRLN